MKCPKLNDELRAELSKIVVVEQRLEFLADHGYVPTPWRTLSNGDYFFSENGNEYMKNDDFKLNPDTEVMVGQPV